MKPHILYITGNEVRERHGPYDVRSYLILASPAGTTCSGCNPGSIRRRPCRHARALAETRERNRNRPDLLGLLVSLR
jgi:hypothetical protein